MVLGFILQIWRTYSRGWRVLLREGRDWQTHIFPPTLHRNQLGQEFPVHITYVSGFSREELQAIELLPIPRPPGSVAWLVPPGAKHPPSAGVSAGRARLPAKAQTPAPGKGKGLRGAPVPKGPTFAPMFAKASPGELTSPAEQRRPEAAAGANEVGVSTSPPVVGRREHLCRQMLWADEAEEQDDEVVERGVGEMPPEELPRETQEEDGEEVLFTGLPGRPAPPLPVGRTLPRWEPGGGPAAMVVSLPCGYAVDGAALMPTQAELEALSRDLGGPSRFDVVLDARVLWEGSQGFATTWSRHEGEYAPCLHRISGHVNLKAVLQECQAGVSAWCQMQAERAPEAWPRIFDEPLKIACFCGDGRRRSVALSLIVRHCLAVEGWVARQRRILRARPGTSIAPCTCPRCDLASDSDPERDEAMASVLALWRALAAGQVRPDAD